MTTQTRLSSYARSAPRIHAAAFAAHLRAPRQDIENSLSFFRKLHVSPLPTAPRLFEFITTQARHPTLVLLPQLHAADLYV